MGARALDQPGADHDLGRSAHHVGRAVRQAFGLDNFQGFLLQAGRHPQFGTADDQGFAVVADEALVCGTGVGMLNEPDAVRGIAGVTIVSGVEDFIVVPFEAQAEVA